ncbi:hypothetical protein PR048_016678 [Dryococelus australis]|uniref:Uncharacterized protein n=1 Tax=Dryococelus australis TaxID=614101 RepID=A0ABQ9H7I2_9NEOP|nr:hypothetical protein PR048_016678 [Dryococelus australis]
MLQDLLMVEVKCLLVDHYTLVYHMQNFNMWYEIVGKSDLFSPKDVSKIAVVEHVAWPRQTIDLLAQASLYLLLFPSSIGHVLPHYWRPKLQKSMAAECTVAGLWERSQFLYAAAIELSKVRTCESRSHHSCLCAIEAKQGEMDCRGVGKPAEPRENPPTSGIVRHDSHMGNSESDPARNRTRFAVVDNGQFTPYSAAESDGLRARTLTAISTPRIKLFTRESTACVHSFSVLILVSIAVANVNPLQGHLFRQQEKTEDTRHKSRRIVCNEMRQICVLRKLKYLHMSGEYGAAPECKCNMRKSGEDPAGNRTRFASVGGEHCNHYTTVDPICMLKRFRWCERQTQADIMSPRRVRTAALLERHAEFDAFPRVAVLERSASQSMSCHGLLETVYLYEDCRPWYLLPYSHPHHNLHLVRFCWDCRSPPPPKSELGSIPSGVTFGFSHVGTVPDEATGQRVFSVVSSNITKILRVPGQTNAFKNMSGRKTRQEANHRWDSPKKGATVFEVIHISVTNDIRMAIATAMPVREEEHGCCTHIYEPDRCIRVARHSVYVDNCCNWYKRSYMTRRAASYSGTYLRRRTKTPCLDRGRASSTLPRKVVNYSTPTETAPRRVSFRPPPVSPPPPEQTRDRDSHKSFCATRRCRARTQLTSLSAGEPGSIPAIRSRISACGNRAGRCRWSTGFIGDLPFPPPCIPALFCTHLSFSLIGSQDLGSESCIDILSRIADKLHQLASAANGLRYAAWSLETEQVVQVTRNVEGIGYILQQGTILRIRLELILGNLGKPKSGRANRESNPGPAERESLDVTVMCCNQKMKKRRNAKVKYESTPMKIAEFCTITGVSDTRHCVCSGRVIEAGSQQSSRLDDG